MDIIYLSGGSGKRAGLGYPKQFALLAGKPIIVHGLEVLQEMPEITKIIIPAKEEEKTREILTQYKITKAKVVPGGKTRQESVKLALKEVETEHVLIGEAVRPFITADFVRRIIETKNDAVSPITRMKASVLLKSGGYIDRDRVGEVQMPQKYRTWLLREAHEKAATKDATDDAVLLIETLGVCAETVDGLEQNIKVTTPLDLKIAEAIYGNCDNRE